MTNDLNQAFLPPVKSDDFLPPISLWTTLGGLFLVGTVASAIALATFVKYNVVVKAAATVRPAGEIRIVQAAMAGSIKRVLVKENESVKRGEAIATIEDSQLQTKKNLLIGNIQNSGLQLTQLNAQIASIDKQRDFELSLMNHNIESAQAELQLNQRNYLDQGIKTQTEVQEAEAELEIARAQMQQYQQLANTGAVAQLQIKEREQTFRSAQAKLQRARSTLNPTAAPVTAATAKIAQEQSRGRVAIATLSKEREVLLQRQIALQNQIDRDKRELLQVDIELKKTVFRSPESGKILKLALRNPGQVVNSGQSIAEIAPGNAALVVKGRVAAQDISKVKVCVSKKVTACEEGKVQLRISAYPYPDYGILKGAVREISPDAIAPQNNTSANAAPYYEITIQPERAALQKSDRSYPLTSGMEVTAEIISKEETVLTFILRKARLLTNI